MRIKEVVEGAVAPEDVVDQDNRDLFEMANLYPDTTGLPMTVWVSPRGNARSRCRRNQAGRFPTPRPVGPLQEHSFCGGAGPGDDHCNPGAKCRRVRIL